MISQLSETRSSGFRSAGIVLAMIAVVAGTLYFGRVIRAPLTASQADVIAPLPKSDLPRETVFAEPEFVSWTAVIEGVLAGGEGLALKRTDTGDRFQAYFAANATRSVPEGPVELTGLLTGISCAYAETVFGGQCVPSVEIERLEPVPIMLIQ
jgi:hypothetical protein